MIDTLRGLAIVDMVTYHLLFDLIYMENYKVGWFVNTPGTIWEGLVYISFISMSGYCFNLSYNHKKHTITLLVVSVVLSAATYFFANEFFIVFRVTHLPCAVSFLTTLVDKLTISKKVLCALSFITSILTYKISVRSMDISSNLFSFVGFYSDEFYNGDYFPSLPWHFTYLVGYCVHNFLDIKLSVGENVLSKTGKESLMIYLIHQPIMVIIVQIVKLLRGINE